MCNYPHWCHKSERVSLAFSSQQYYTILANNNVSDPLRGSLCFFFFFFSSIDSLEIELILIVNLIRKFYLWGIFKYCAGSEYIPHIICVLNERVKCVTIAIAVHCQLNRIICWFWFADDWCESSSLARVEFFFFYISYTVSLHN